MSTPEMCVTIPCGTGRLCAYHFKHSRSKFKQEVCEGCLQQAVLGIISLFVSIFSST